MKVRPYFFVYCPANFELLRNGKRFLRAGDVADSGEASLCFILSDYLKPFSTAPISASSRMDCSPSPLMEMASPKLMQA